MPYSFGDLAIYIDMAIYRDKWFECWFSDGSDVLPTYLLLVTPDPEKAGNILVVDPLKNNEIVYREGLRGRVFVAKRRRVRTVGGTRISG